MKKNLRQCIICKKQEGRPFTEPQIAPLPEYRVREAPPFSNIGVDFAGPLYVRQDKGKMVNVVCLFLCCVTRALHLELIGNLSNVFELSTTLLCKERNTIVNKFR